MTKSSSRNAIHGWLIIDKPLGITSAQVLGKFKRLYRPTKIGHAGTLDPLASGVLPVALGEATKTVSYLQDAGKSYRFTVRWGQARSTDDMEGEVTAESDSRPSRADILAMLPPFTGVVMQLPPSFSALKIDGKRAYDLARAGEEVILQPRQVRIDRLELMEMPDADHAIFEMDCGKGTYVRSVARDLGELLGCHGHVAELRRTRVGKFHEANAISLDFLESHAHNPAALPILAIADVLDDIPAITVDAAASRSLRCGQAIQAPYAISAETALALHEGTPVALVRHEDGLFRSVRVFNL